jgi:hypothetical protein
MLRQYYWRYDSYSANRQSAANMTNPQNLKIGAAKAPRFAYERNAHRSANIFFNVAPIVLALSRSHRFTYCSRTRL